MDVFIVITCAMNEVYDSREFYKPIVTPFDVEKAFNPNSQSLKFTFDYNSFLGKVLDNPNIEPLNDPDVSLLTGKLRINNSENLEENASTEGKNALNQCFRVLNLKSPLQKHNLINLNLM